MRILEILEQLFSFCFSKLLSARIYPNIYGGIRNEIDESLVLNRTLNLTNPPSFYSSETTDLYLSLIERAKSSILKENFSPFFTNSLAIEIDVAVKVFSYLQNYLPNDISKLCFSSNEYISFILAKSQEKSNLKDFRLVRIFFHHWKVCSKAGGSNNCQSLHFTQDKIKATTIEDLQATFGNVFIELKSKKVLIVYIELVSCMYPEWVGHATVLVATKVEGFLWAFYCDSNGHDMPPILRTFLEETFKRMADIYWITGFYLTYLNERQQVINSGCTLFTIINANLMGKKMAEGVSFEEIRRALNYQPSEDCLRETFWKFFDNFGRKLCYDSINKILLLIHLIEKLIQSPLLTCSNNQELKKTKIIIENLQSSISSDIYQESEAMKKRIERLWGLALSITNNHNQELEDLKKTVKVLNNLIDVFKKISEIEGNIISESNKKFFSEEVLKFEKTLSETPLLLNKAFSRYYNSLAILFEQKRKKTSCIECKNRIEAREEFCFEKMKWLNSFHFSFSTFYNWTLKTGSSLLEHLVQELKAGEETESFIVVCSLCQRKTVTEKSLVSQELIYAAIADINCSQFILS